MMNKITKQKPKTIKIIMKTEVNMNPHHIVAILKVNVRFHSTIKKRAQQPHLCMNHTNIIFFHIKISLTEVLYLHMQYRTKT